MEMCFRVKYSLACRRGSFLLFNGWFFSFIHSTERFTYAIRRSLVNRSLESFAKTNFDGKRNNNIMCLFLPVCCTTPSIVIILVVLRIDQQENAFHCMTMTKVADSYQSDKTYTSRKLCREEKEQKGKKKTT